MADEEEMREIQFTYFQDVVRDAKAKMEEEEILARDTNSSSYQACWKATIVSYSEKFICQQL